jgi:hypothetical protein
MSSKARVVVVLTGAPVKARAPGTVVAVDGAAVAALAAVVVVVVVTTVVSTVAPDVVMLSGNGPSDAPDPTVMITPPLSRAVPAVAVAATVKGTARSTEPPAGS